VRRFLELARQALEGARRARLRAALTVLGIAIATGALVAMIAFALGLEQRVEEPFTKLGLFHTIRVTAPKDSDLRLDDEALARFAALPGAAAAYPELRVRSIDVSRGDERRTVVAFGLPREIGLAGLSSDLLSAGRWFGPGDDVEVLVGRRLASDLGFDPPADAVGSSVTLVAAGLAPADTDGETQLTRREVEARVVGVFEVPPFAHDLGARTIVVPIDVAQALPGVDNKALEAFRASGALPDGPTRAIVRAVRLTDVPALARRIEDLGFEAESLQEQFAEARQLFAFLEVLLAAVGTVALAVAGLGILNTQLMAVLERKAEIGLLKALGATDGDVRTMFLTEALVLGLAGGVAGVLLALLVTAGLQVGIDLYLESEGFEPVGVFRFAPWLVGGAVLFAAGISVVSGLYPAGRAARLDPVRAVRGE
jgi:putative ABC transport system permease protein